MVSGSDSINRNEISADTNTCEPINCLTGLPTGTSNGLGAGPGDGLELFSWQLRNTASTVPCGWEARTRECLLHSSYNSSATSTRICFVFLFVLHFWTVLCVSWSPRINEMNRREKLSKFIMYIAHQ